ncbi:MerR family transcriptional regulator [Microbacterium sp. BK668]|uniref:MerR family transcriptional regulator n=1 Tax=Microbacterium sp. BK668 TaxID=2512118 RepID=UPI0010D67764|nr:MerR family transcriptional regulator [Microbacterium sp. BK668]TDN91624.1 MerR-like DNA binding protein [Microbacterium sp. BK668]
MKISQLSEHTGVPVATLKMYLREGLLHPGAKSGPNQASYDETHVARVHLAQSLVRVGGLSIASAREVIAAAASDLPLVETFGIAQRAASGDARALDDGETAALARVREVTADWDLHGSPEGEQVGTRMAARALAALERSGQPPAPSWLERYAAAALLVAEADLDLVDARDGRDAKAQTVVVGTVLGDHVFAGLRRAAQEHISNTRYSGSTSSRGTAS